MKRVLNTEKMTKWYSEKAKNAERKGGLKGVQKVQMKNPIKDETWIVSYRKSSHYWQ